MQLNPATEQFAASLAATLPQAAFREFSARYSEDLRGLFDPDACLVVAPFSTDQVALIVRRCSEARVPIVPFGGGTGLVGGHTPIDIPKPVLVSLENMNEVREVDTTSCTMTVDAGCILEIVHQIAARHGMMFPLSLASKGSCQIGGNLGTNAGGVHVLRYGNMRDLCLGLEVVLPDGNVWNGLSTLRKDNFGLDFRNLLIGSEGTLGIITGASLRLFRRHADSIAALVAVRSPAQALELLGFLQSRFGSLLSAYELLGRTGFEFLEETGLISSMPFRTMPDWMVLLQAEAESEFGLQEIVSDCLGEASEKFCISDAILAQSGKGIEELWSMREAMPEANRRIGSVSSHDISIPVRSIASFIEQASKRVSECWGLRVNCFGHLGDGNLHFNVFPQKEIPVADVISRRNEIKTAVTELVRELGGSLSAEHGVGRLKAKELESHADPVLLEATRRIKDALDPAGIMNPGAVFRIPGVDC